MQQDFDSWNEIKKKLDYSNPEFARFPQAGEVWMCILGKNIGYEQNGAGANFSRPVLIIKKFNNQMFWTVPLSTKQKSFDFYYNFTDPEGQDVSIILAQLRLMSIKRFGRKLYDFGNKFDEIKMQLRKFME